MNYLAALLRLMRRHLVPSQRGGPNGQRRSSYQPSIQALEDRWLPANIVWTGAMSDDWNTAGNWSLARVPGADDDVTINIERRAVLGASHTATVKSVAVDRASELIVDGWLLAGKVQNSGWLEVNDGATLEINRTGADALVTNLGNLLLSGRIEGSVDNKEQGIRLSSIFVFSSNAVIHGNLKDGGRINLEEATYRLKVLGDFEQTADGTLAMTIHLQNRAYISSQLTVRGKAKIAGSLVLESTVFNNYPQGTEVTVMFYDSLEGKFKEEFWDIKNAAGRFLPGYHKNSFDVYVPFLVHNWPADNFTNRFTEAFVAEGRIGNAGNDAAGNFTFELDVGRTTSAPASKSDYDWDPGTYSFALTYDPALSADSVSLTVSGATGTKTVSFQFDPAAWASTENDALFLRTRAVRAGSGIVLSDLQLATPGLGRFVTVNEAEGPGPAMVSAVGPDARHSLQVMGTDLQQGFTLTGNVAWAFPESGPNVPKQSELAFQLKVGTWRNDAPAAADDFAVTNGQTPVDVFVLANDRDPNGDPLTILILTQPRFGTVEIHGQDTPDDPADDFIRYLPGAEYVGSDSFTYAVRDRYGAVSTATVTVAEFGQALNGVFAEDSIWPQAL